MYLLWLNHVEHLATYVRIGSPAVPRVTNSHTRAPLDPRFDNLGDQTEKDIKLWVFSSGSILSFEASIFKLWQ